MSTINENIAKNITFLRKERKMTQQELASKLNISDKAISKWERADSTPDIETLCSVAKLFNVNVDYLTKEHTKDEITKTQSGKNILVRNLLIMIFGCVSVFLLSTIVFVYATLRNPDNAKQYWVSFVLALPLCCLINYLYARMNKIWLMQMISISLAVWTLITGIYCITIIVDLSNFWMLFIIGVPIQIAICLFYFWKSIFK